MGEINSKQNQKIRLQIVEGAEGISEFGECWGDLFARAVDIPPFLSCSWVSTFIQERRVKGTSLFILAWMSVSFFGQLSTLVYCCFGMIGSLCSPGFNWQVPNRVSLLRNRPAQMGT